MDALFWIETVLYEIDVPEIQAGAEVILSPVKSSPDMVSPTFSALLPFVEGKKFVGGRIRVPGPQIQYSQKVILNFAGLAWPHVSVATLVPSDPIPIPPALLPLT